MNTARLSSEGLQNLIKDHASRQLELGRYLMERGKLAAAELCFEQALRESQEKRISIAALAGKAEIYKRRKSFTEAHQALATAQKLAEEVGDLKLVGLVLQHHAEVASAEDLPPVALEKLKAAREAFTRIGAEAIVERTQVALKLGLVAQELLQSREAATYYAEAEQLAQEKILKVLSLIGQANALMMLGQFAEALRKCAHAEELLDQDAPNVMELARVTVELKAACHESLGDLETAAKSYEKALTLAPAKEQARICSQLAVLKFSMGLPQEAQQYEARTQQLLQELNGELPDVLFQLSKLNMLRGQVRTAERQFLQALLGLPSKSNKLQEIGVKQHRISLDVQLGRIPSASKQAQALYQELVAAEAPALLVTVLQTLGDLSRIQGDLDRAESYYKEALEIAEQSQMRPIQAAILGSLAQIAAVRLEASAALHYLDRAILLSEACGAELCRQNLLVHKADILSRQVGNSAEAIALLEDLVRKSGRFQSLPLELAIQTTLATIHWRESRYAQAREHLEEALDKEVQAGLEFAKVVTQGMLGSILADQGENRLAEQHLREAIEAMDVLGLEIEAKDEFRERLRTLTGFWF